MSAGLPPLPEGFRARPLTVDDAGLVAVLGADCEEFEDGVRLLTTGDVLSMWNHPGLDLASCSIGVFAGERLVAGGSVIDEDARIDVHPAFRGHGLGSTLLPWTWAVARGQGATRVGQIVSDRRPDAAEPFRSFGYEADSSAWDFEMELVDVGEPRFPDGYEVADLVYERDAHEAFEVIDAAFASWRDGPGEGYGAWNSFMSTHPALAEWASPIVRREGRIVGVAIGFDYGREHSGWVQQLAVDESHRGRGLGRALLETSFGRFRERGYTHGGLATGSRSGVRSLYEHVGLTVRHSYTHWSKTL